MAFPTPQTVTSWLSSLPGLAGVRVYDRESWSPGLGLPLPAAGTWNLLFLIEGRWGHAEGVIVPLFRDGLEEVTREELVQAVLRELGHLLPPARGPHLDRR